MHTYIIPCKPTPITLSVVCSDCMEGALRADIEEDCLRSCTRHQGMTYIGYIACDEHCMQCSASCVDYDLIRCDTQTDGVRCVFVYHDVLRRNRY